MKKILLCTTLILAFTLPTYALTRNPYGIYYAHVYDNGKYSVKIIDVTKKSVAQKVGISKASTIKSINNNGNLNFKNTRMYFDSSLLSITTIGADGNENSYNLKAKDLDIVKDNDNFQKKYNKYVQKNKYSKAINLLEKYLSKYPNDMEAIERLINTLLLNGQYGEAITNLDNIYNITKSPAILGTMSSVYLSINDVENAKKYAQQTLNLDKSEPIANATMFICTMEDSKFNEALNHANKLVEKDSKSYTSYFYRGLAEMNLKSYVNAYKDLEKAFKMATENKIDATPIVVAMVDWSDLMIKSTTAKSKHFVEVPSWYDICPGEYVYSNGKNPKWNLYWGKRRIAYLRSIFNSVTNYSGEELYKSYKSILNKEYRQNDDYKVEREHTWNQERREEIYRYTKDILTTALVGAYVIKTAPTHSYVHHSGNINQNVNLSGSITRYNHYYFH